MPSRTLPRHRSRALSVRQPYAGLICAGIKRIENRSWRTAYRGELLIHAARKIDPAGLEMMRRLGVELPDMPIGGIVGRAQLVDCARDVVDGWASPDCWHWILADAEPLAFEPMPGRLGLFQA